MPQATRRETAEETRPESAPGDPAQKAASTEDQAEAALAVLGRSAVRVVRLPATVAGAVAGDISSTARRPDAVLYWGGLAGLAALGVLEWPAAAAIGVGVAVANGVRRVRS